MNKSNYIKILVSLLIGIVLILLWLKFIDIDELVYHLKNINIIYIAPALCFYLASYLLRSQRLRTLLSHKTDIPIFTNYTYVLAGNFLNYLIPIRAGEVGKAIFYKKNHDIRYSESLPSIFIDKIFDTYAIFVVLLLIPLTSIELSPELHILLSLLIIIFIIGFLILFIASKSPTFVVKLLQKLLFFIPKKYTEKIHSFLSLFVDGIAIFRQQKKIIYFSIIYTLLATLTDSLFFMLMFTAFGVQISFLKVLFGYTLIFLSYIIPHPPGQIGSNEWIMWVIFAVGFGMDKDLSGAVMVFTHLITGIVVVVTGLLSLAFAGIKMKDIFKGA